MGEGSAIAWCNDTFNPWHGCVEVSPGYSHCYARDFSKRIGHGKRLPMIWGVDATRKPMSEDYWRQPARWNRKASRDGVRRRVFCASMADVFEMPPERNVDAWRVLNEGRARLRALIETTPWLTWLLLTKRPENIEEIDLFGGVWPENVWLGATTEDQKHYDKRWPILAEHPAAVHFVSHEPALGPLTIRPAEGGALPDWVITGGESGHGARAYLLNWAAGIVEQCRANGIAPFVKQLGARPFLEGVGLLDDEGDGAVDVVRVALKDRKGADPSEWPDELRIQEFPTQRSAACPS